MNRKEFDCGVGVGASWVCNTWVAHGIYIGTE